MKIQRTGWFRGSLVLIFLAFVIDQPCAKADQPIELTGHGNAVYDVEFTPDGRLLASGSYDKTVKLWDPDSGRNVATYKGHQDQVFRIAFAPDGKSLASCSGDGTTMVWNLETGHSIRTLSSHRDPMLDVDYSPDGSLIATAGAHIQVWKDDKELWSTPHLESFYSLTFSPDGHSIACGTRDLIQIFSVDQTEPTQNFTEVKGMVYQVAYSHDGKWLVAASSDGSVSLWDAQSGEFVRSVTADQSALFDAAFSSDSRLLVTGGRERVIRVWRMPELELLSERYGPQETILAVSFSPDRRQIASGDYGGTMHLWTLEE